MVVTKPISSRLPPLLALVGSASLGIGCLLWATYLVDYGQVIGLAIAVVVRVAGTKYEETWSEAGKKVPEWRKDVLGILDPAFISFWSPRSVRPLLVAVQVVFLSMVPAAGLILILELATQNTS